MKLNKQNLSQLDKSVVLPSYTLDQRRQGIAHIGVGGFHRAHQAFYTDALMNLGATEGTGEGLDWAICGVSLREEDRANFDALQSQDFLFTLFELGDTPDTETRIIGSMDQMLMSTDNDLALIDKLASPDIRIVSLTITEGGYCIDDSTGEFMSHLPQIQYDLAHPATPKTVFGYLCAALSKRRAEGTPAFTLMSCDNLPHNGGVTRKALLAFAKLRDPQLHDWIAEQVSFPNAMVDRITPMTSTAHRLQLHDQKGIDDAWPVVCEPFVQWVLEDKFVNGRPAWEKVGVQFTDDVTPYEEMKIKLLNGSHLALTYLGALKGYRFVHETMNDPLFVEYIRTYMDRDVTQQLPSVPGIDLESYKDTLIERFSNQAIADQLERVCSDGSSKFPKFTVPTINRLILDDGNLDRASLVVAAWALYLQGNRTGDFKGENGVEYKIVDPRADFCKALVTDDVLVTQRLLEVEEIFGAAIPKSPAFVASFEKNLNSLKQLGVSKTLEKLLGKNA
ncbi:mannitol dehydrogenase family protein [Pseudomonas huanghezhanensis]|uniref:mannitol dehydrogenase family protein n=1 Tax=Pseudomonas huanghezhanensis TaxID=3002903 RepID=UPI0022864D99|nr:mannitol dehydrogenase family protein [Pseudomonas sp. BSw22131]